MTGESTPLVDNRSTLIAHNVSAEEFDRLPKGRSFQSIALTAPSVNQGEIEGGLQVNGASGSENAFTVDGVVTNSLVNGQSRQNTVFEYLQEVQVKTSGIAAEYGGALGGVISAVTKSGGNTVPRRGPLLLRGQRARSRSGQAARPRSRGRPYRDLRPGPRAAGQAERVRRIARRPDCQGPSLLLRGVFAPQRERDQLVCGLRRRPGRGAQHLASAGVRQAVVHAAPVDGALVHALDAHDGRRHALELQRGDAERLRRQPVLADTPARSRLRDQSGEHERHGGPQPVERRLPALPRRLLSRPLQRHRHPARHVVHLPDTDDAAERDSAAGTAGRDERGRSEHAAGADHRLRPDQALGLRRGLQPRLQPEGLSHAQGGIRLPAHRERHQLVLPGRLHGDLLGPQLHVQRRDDRSRHLRLLRRQRSRHHQQGGQRHPLAVHPGSVDRGQPPDAEPRAAHRTRGGADFPARHRQERLRVRLRREAGAASRRGVRPPRRRPVEGVRQLGPLLRLDEVSAAARIVRCGDVVHLLSRARHAGARPA